MQARADLARAALPNCLIDTDDWVHTDYGKWVDLPMAVGQWRKMRACYGKAKPAVSKKIIRPVNLFAVFV